MTDHHDALPTRPANRRRRTRRIHCPAVGPMHRVHAASPSATAEGTIPRTCPAAIPRALKFQNDPCCKNVKPSCCVRGSLIVIHTIYWKHFRQSSTLSHGRLHREHHKGAAAVRVSIVAMELQRYSLRKFFVLSWWLGFWVKGLGFRDSGFESWFHDCKAPQA